MDRSLLFVYGTLKKGGGLHSVLGKSSEFVGTYITEENKYDMHDVGCPIMLIDNDSYLLNENKGFHIRGEIYNVTPEAMERVTMVECNAGYVPFIVKAYEEDYPEGEPLKAIAFIYPNAYGNNASSHRITEIENIKEWVA